MRMADNGYRPAFNVQLAVDADTRAIVGVGVTNSGSDAEQMTPMIDEVERRTGKTPKEWLADGGYTDLSDIQSAGEKGVGQLLILSQVVLSMQLGFAVVPLVRFTGDRRKMGRFANGPALSAAAWTIAAVIVGLNAYLLLQTARGWLAG